MEIKLDLSVTPFSLEHTLQCGQLFRWEKIGDHWYGVVREKIIKAKQKHDTLCFQVSSNTTGSEFIRHYFRLDDDLPCILSQINKDCVIKEAVKSVYGLRLIRQEPWECLISYICATYKNIPAIKRMIWNLSRKFGRKIEFETYEFYTFPTPNKLASASLKELKSCELGFRAASVFETAKIIECGEFDFEALRKTDYVQAKKALMSLPGVGNKVADCILLFSLDKLEAFPVDVWVKRVVLEHYIEYLDSKFLGRLSRENSLTAGEYSKVSEFGRKYFGIYAGYAQEYLYHWKRSVSGIHKKS